MALLDHWAPAYLGVGSNLDDPAAQVGRALTNFSQNERLCFKVALYSIFCLVFMFNEGSSSS